MDTGKIVFVGAGNVTESLARAIHNSGLHISTIISRDPEKSRYLADEIGCNVTDLFEVPDSTGIVVIAVPDGAIPDVVNRLRVKKEVVVVHTSGSTGIDVFPDSVPLCGVLYPLQTFTRGEKVSCEGVPFFTEASDEKTHRLIDSLASSAGGVVHHLNSKDRSQLHIAAVFICNFVNHMIFAGSEIVSETGYGTAVFEPLLRETIRKAIVKGAGEAQTGPAIRGDRAIIEKHLKLLEKRPEIRDVYEAVSRSIIINSKNEK